MRSDRLSLRQRLLFLLLLPILLLVAVWSWAAYAIALHFTNLAYDRALEDTAQTLAGQVKITGRNIEVNLPPAARQMLEFDQTDTVYFSISDHLGKQLIGNRILPANPESSAIVNESSFYDDRLDGQAVRLVEFKAPSALANDVLFVRVAETLHKRENVAREVLAFMLAPQLFFLCGVVVLVWYGVGRGIAPLSRIRDAIARRTHEDLRPLAETGLPAEVHEQVHVINDLMLRLGKTIDTQRRFIADATHQLRTPITVLRTQIELALRAESPNDLRAIVTQLDAATARLARLANQLLNLNRAESGLTGNAEFEWVAVAALVEDVVAALVPAALAKKIELKVDIAESLPDIRGDRQLLSEMLANLVDNAIRYTQSGGSIDIAAKDDRDGSRLTIIDNGPGIPESEYGRVFERFYRVGNSASEGSGLGLSIAQEIAILHGGKITLAPAAAGIGLSVTVDIPHPP